MVTEVRLEGGRKFRSTLKQAGIKLDDLKAVHAMAAAIAAEASASLAPVRTGRLRRTIRSSGTTTAGIIRAGNNTRIPYAGPIHWGWFRRNIKPQPFISQGARDSEGRWLPVYMDYVEDAVQLIEGI